MVRPLPSPPRRGEATLGRCGGRRSGARYPDLRVTVRSRNPLVLVAAVREELRLAGVERAEIDRFSREALEADGDFGATRRIAARWIGHLQLGGANGLTPTHR